MLKGMFLSIVLSVRISIFEWSYRSISMPRVVKLSGLFLVAFLIILTCKCRVLTWYFNGRPRSPGLSSFIVFMASNITDGPD